MKVTPDHICNWNGDNFDGLEEYLANILNGKFSVNKARAEILEYNDIPYEVSQELVDQVIEQIKQDIHDGDLTVLDELLKFIPEEFLKGSLPEE